MPLTDTKIRNTKPNRKPIKLTDGNGLYLEVRPSGTKLWRYRYRIDGKENVYAIGVYPSNRQKAEGGFVSLAEARTERDRARALVKKGIHPAHVRATERASSAVARKNTFRAVALEWLEGNRPDWSASYYEQISSNLERHVYPAIGARPIKTITAADVLQIVRTIDRSGAPTMAALNRNWMSSVFRYAIVTLRADNDPTAPIKGAIKVPKTKHHPALPREEIPTLLKKLDDYGGRITTIFAMRLLLLTFVRGGELRQAQWPEIDFENALWRIPAERMKNREPHTVPLARQALALLHELNEVTAHQRWLFPGYGRDRCMNAHTLTSALRYMGYKGGFSAHGFRSTASTIMNEMGYRPDVIERQLAHIDRNSVRASYNRAEYLPERIEMMQQWADYLDSLESGIVVPLNRART